MVSFTAEQRFIVTGASSGIGEGVALLLNELGATVIGIGRNVERLNGMKAKTKNPENMFLEQKNLVEDIQGLPVYVKELKEKYGKFSGMVYCAGVSALMPAKAYDFSYAQEIFLNNYFAPLFMTKGLIDKRNTVGRGTAIVIISSIDAILATRGQSLYSGAKGALCSTMRAISKEITPYGYRVNCILPSMIKTPMAGIVATGQCGLTEADERYPFGWGEPLDVANMAAFLLSDRARFISGQNYVLDSGGML